MENFENTIHNIYDVSDKLAKNSESLDVNLNSIVKADSEQSVRGIKQSMDTIVDMVTSQNCCKIKGMVWGLFSRGYRL